MKNTATSALARKVKSLRLAAGLTQVELAVKADLSLQTIAGIEQGHRSGSPRTLRKLASAFGKKPTELSTSRS